MAITPSRSFKVTDYGASLIDHMRLLVNTNLHAIAHRFQVIADYWLNILERGRGTSSTHSFGMKLYIDHHDMCLQIPKQRSIRLVPNTFRCFEPFRRRPRVRSTDGHIDGQKYVSNSAVERPAL